MSKIHNCDKSIPNFFNCRYNSFSNNTMRFFRTCLLNHFHNLIFRFLT
uniref:Uncharacterized protein n=1 Tax=Heterorhabditis bacteriophora TaxID=37862 RepID=A0A1I7W927_HETBA